VGRVARGRGRAVGGRAPRVEAFGATATRSEGRKRNASASASAAASAVAALWFDSFMND